MKAIINKIIRETEKAIFAEIQEDWREKSSDANGNIYIASKEMWLPKSVIIDGEISEWFCLKNGNFGWV